MFLTVLYAPYISELGIETWTEWKHGKRRVPNLFLQLITAQCGIQKLKAMQCAVSKMVCMVFYDTVYHAA